MIRMPLLLLVAVALTWTSTEFAPSRSTSAAHCEVSGCVGSVGDSAQLFSFSSLWGIGGESWKPAGRLPDFSYAGYHAGEAKIPTARATLNFKTDFHAAATAGQMIHKPC